MLLRSVSGSLGPRAHKNTLLCRDLQIRQLLNHFDATARQDDGTPYERPREELRSHGASISRSHGIECEQRVPLSPSSCSSASLFSVCCQNMPWPQGGGGCHMLAQMPVLINCRYLRTVSVQRFYTRIPIRIHIRFRIRMYAVWLEPGKIYSMLLIELN